MNSINTSEHADATKRALLEQTQKLMAQIMNDTMPSSDHSWILSRETYADHEEVELHAFIDYAYMNSTGDTYYMDNDFFDLIETRSLSSSEDELERVAVMFYIQIFIYPDKVELAMGYNTDDPYFKYSSNEDVLLKEFTVIEFLDLNINDMVETLEAYL